MSAPNHPDKDIIKQNTQALHKHLETQFYGVITKLTQEIDTIAHISEVLAPLQRLQDQLNAACSVYCNSYDKDLKQAIEEFHQSCQRSINEYKTCPQIQKTLRLNNVAQETIENMFTRFSSGIQSAIYYTLNHTCLPIEEQQKLSAAYQLLSTLGSRLRQLGGSKGNKLSQDEDNSTKITPQ